MPEERQIPFVAEMNADFRDGYGSVPMSNHLGPAHVRIDLLPHRRCPPPAEPHGHNARNGQRTSPSTDAVRQVPPRPSIGARAGIFRPRDYYLARRHSFTRISSCEPELGRQRRCGHSGSTVRADKPGVGENLSNHAILFIGLLQKRGMRQAAKFSPSDDMPSATPPTCPARRRLDMYLNVQCKTSWSALGHQVANLAPSLLKPMARGRVALTAADPAAYPLVEFNFTGHELDLQRFMQGFRRCADALAHDAVRTMTRLTFPVKFNDRLRRLLNRITPGNKIKSAAGCRADRRGAAARWRQFLPPLADRRVDLATLVEDDAALADHVRNNVAGTFHPVGTCRMGRRTIATR